MKSHHLTVQCKFIKRLKTCVLTEGDSHFIFTVCFTGYFVFSIAISPHSLRIVCYNLLLRCETRIPGVARFSFRIGVRCIINFVSRRNSQKGLHHPKFKVKRIKKLKDALYMPYNNPRPPYETGPGIEPEPFGFIADECCTTELTLFPYRIDGLIFEKGLQGRISPRWDYKQCGTLSDGEGQVPVQIH